MIDNETFTVSQGVCKDLEICLAKQFSADLDRKDARIASLEKGVNEQLQRIRDLIARAEAAEARIKAWEEAEADDVAHWHNLAVADERSGTLWKERAEAAEAEAERLTKLNALAGELMSEHNKRIDAAETRAEAAEAEVARLRAALSKRKMVMGEDGVLHLMKCEKCGESVGTDALGPSGRDEGAEGHE